MKDAAVFVLLGQSNAVGHALPMAKKDIIDVPLERVYGLEAKENQSFSGDFLVFKNFVSAGMNLGETQDNTYSVSNCMAKLWDKRQKNGENIPDLYVIQIAIGAQGITKKFMWYPDRAKKLIPGELGKADISLYPLTIHIIKLLGKWLKEGDREVVGIHWIGGENDVEAADDELCELGSLYGRMLNDFENELFDAPVVFHKIVCKDRMSDLDKSGKFLENMNFINSTFEKLEKKYKNVTVFDPTKAPYYKKDVRGNGIFGDDVVHFTKEMNFWKAEQIIEEYLGRGK